MCSAAAVGNGNGVGRAYSRGGPTGATVVDKQKSDSLHVTLRGIVVVSDGSVVVVGSPRRQLEKAAAGAANWRGRPEEIVLLPPFILKAVASSLCPSALRRQVREV
jgi:hypothetical protein